MFFMLICSVFTAIATSVLESLLIKAMMKACGVTYIVPAKRLLILRTGS